MRYLCLAGLLIAGQAYADVPDRLRKLFLVSAGFMNNAPHHYGGYVMYEKDLNQNFCNKPKGSLLLVDHEGGSVNRLKSNLPAANKAFKTSNYLDIWRQDAKSLKKHCVDVVLGPTVDPLLGARSFSSDLSKNIKYSQDIINIISSNHMIATLKHFPGRITECEQKNPKRELEYCDSTKKEILSQWKDLNNPPVIMISNYIYSNVSPLPAVVEEDYYNMLRKDLNYKGIIMTDALWEMSVPVSPKITWEIFKHADLIMIMNAYEVEKSLPYLEAQLKQEGLGRLEEKEQRLEQLKKILSP